MQVSSSSLTRDIDHKRLPALRFWTLTWYLLLNLNKVSIISINLLKVPSLKTKSISGPYSLFSLQKKCYYLTFNKLRHKICAKILLKESKRLIIIPWKLNLHFTQHLHSYCWVPSIFRGNKIPCLLNTCLIAKFLILAMQEVRIICRLTY